MEYDYVAAEEIRKEMEELVKSIFINNTTANLKNAICFDIEKMSAGITEQLIEINSNEYEDPICPIQITPPRCEVTSHRVIIIHDGFTDGAKSTKLGNIKLDLKKLCILSSESIFPIVAATHMPWLIPFAALVICNKFWSLQNIQITERDAAVIWTMWNYITNHNKLKKNNIGLKNCINAEMVLGLVNKELSNFKRPEMTQKELNVIIKNLETMRCIEKTEGEKICLIEKIIVTY